MRSILGGLVGGERPAHLGQARGAGVGRPDHLDRMVLDAVAAQAVLQHRDELGEGDAIAAFGALVRPGLVADRLEQRRLGDDRLLRRRRQAAGEIDRHGHARHGTGARGELRHVEGAELPVVRGRRRPQIGVLFNDRDRIRAKLGLALEGGGGSGGNPKHERKEQDQTAHGDDLRCCRSDRPAGASAEIMPNSRAGRINEHGPSGGRRSASARRSQLAPACSCSPIPTCDRSPARPSCPHPRPREPSDAHDSATTRVSCAATVRAASLPVIDERPANE